MYVIYSESFLHSVSTCVFFFSSRRRHTRLQGDWSSDVCSSDLGCGPREEVRRTNALEIALTPWRLSGRRPAPVTPVGQPPAPFASVLVQALVLVLLVHVLDVVLEKEDVRLARPVHLQGGLVVRSEERRVGKECRS